MDYILKENRKITKIVFLSLGFYNKITWTKKKKTDSKQPFLTLIQVYSALKNLYKKNSEKNS